MRSRSWIFSIFALALLPGCAHNAHFLDAERFVFGTTTDRSSSYTDNSDVVAVEDGWSTTTVVQTAYDSDAAGPYRLDTGDRLRIFIYGQPNLSRLYTVGHDGRIAVPLIGNVNARGLTTSGLASVIRRKLGSRYVRDPKVSVDIHQNRPFFILGEVRNAGQYPYVSGMTVETAIAIAGGYSERASMRSYRLTRRVDGTTEEFQVPADYTINPGDTVFVYERFF